jgi:hypothetical protein
MTTHIIVITFQIFVGIPASEVGLGKKSNNTFIDIWFQMLGKRSEFLFFVRARIVFLKY